MSQSATVVTLIDGNGSSQKVTLSQELASGGAGIVYSVSDDPTKVVKLYRDETLKQDGTAYAAKLACMLKHVPALTSAGAFIQAAWPSAIANNKQGSFIGFAMPAVDFQKTELLESMLIPKQAAAKNLRSGLEARIVVAANLSLVVKAIHEQGHQIVDLKPPNLRIYRKELYVAVLDCDGFHIRVPGQNLSAPQATPEYLAPEFHGKVITDPEAQDRFALAAILFRVLNFGIHPYDGLPKSKNAPTDREGRVSRGMYAYGLRPSASIEPLPVSAHASMPEEVRLLFDRAFGTIPSIRPSAEEWSGLLTRYAQVKNGLLSKCASRHLWFSGMSCGVCHREKVLDLSRKFDMNEVWAQIESVSSPSEIGEIDPDFYDLQPPPIPAAIVRAKKLLSLQKVLALVLVPALLWLTALHIVFIMVVATVWYQYPFGRGRIRREVEARTTQLNQAQDRYDTLRLDWEENGATDSFEKLLQACNSRRSEYEKIDEQCEESLANAIEEARGEQLKAFLKSHKLEAGLIDGIGAGLVERLKQEHIFSAYSVSRKNLEGIEGFGQSRIDRLVEWKKEIKASFSFDKAHALSKVDEASIREPFERKALAIETRLKQAPEELQLCKIKILQYRQNALRPLCDAAKELKEAQISLSQLN